MKQCNTTFKEWKSHKEYTCIPESAYDEQCKNCKWYKEV